MKKQERTQKPVNQIKEVSKPRGRPVTNDIMTLHGSIPATPEELAKVILSTPPREIKS